jgi:ABC-type uncharacterized transport system substrate-binding protein
MFKQSDIKRTLVVENSDLLAFLLDTEAKTSMNERQTQPVSYAGISELLLLDIMSDLEDENFEVIR